MKKKLFFGMLAFGIMFAPLAFAIQSDPPQTTSGIKNICINANMKSVEGIVNWGTCLLSRSVAPFLMALAVVGFVYGVIQYFLNPDNEEKRKNGKTFMLWGLIALFVIVSIWGLVGVLTNTFETGDAKIPTLPPSK